MMFQCIERKNSEVTEIRGIVLWVITTLLMAGRVDARAGFDNVLPGADDVDAWVRVDRVLARHER